jgi:hypothetical protein
VLNRKNSLFAGNPRGGRTAAILASLTSTRRRHDIDPQLYSPSYSSIFPQHTPIGQTLAAEALRERHGLEVSRETLRKSSNNLYSRRRRNAKLSIYGE